MPTIHAPLPAGRQLSGIVDFTGPVVAAADLHVDDVAPGSVVACIGTDDAMLDAVPALVAAGHEVRVFEDRPRLILPDGGGFPTCAGALAAVAVPVRFAVERAAFLPAPSALRRRLEHVPVHLQRRAGSWHRRRLLTDSWMRRQVTPAPHDHRPPLHADAYYEALAGERCRLVSWPIDRLTEVGIRTCDGLEHRVDVIVVGR